MVLRLAKMMPFLTLSGAEQLAQRLALGLGVMRRLDQHLGDGLGGGRAAARLRRAPDCAGRGGEPLDLGRHGGGEEQRLPGEGQQLADALDVRDEAHVEHPVGLVDHQHVDAGEQELAALEMVEQAARRGDDDIGAAVDLQGLRLEGDAADEQRHVEIVHLAQRLEGLAHLVGQFARGLEDEGARHAGAGAALFQQRQHGQHEGGGLAGARSGRGPSRRGAGGRGEWLRPGWAWGWCNPRR